MFIPRVLFSQGLILLALGSIVATGGSRSLIAQEPSARNIFWSANDLFEVSQNPATIPNSNHAQQAPPRKAVAPQQKPHPNAHVDPAAVVKNGYGRQPQFVPVSNEQMGIRYSLLLRDSTRSFVEVSPNMIFHSGDHLRLSVMTNQPGFLYVIHQGSTGTWSTIFPKAKPAPTSGGEVKEIEQGRVYQIPDKEAFLFDRNPGQERLFLVLSRERISDLDSTIASLKDSSSPSPTPARPQTEEPTAASQVLETANQIPDAIVKTLTSRDLTLVKEEQVDDSPKGKEKGEKAVYVVSKVSNSGRSNSRVVALVILHHE